MDKVGAVVNDNTQLLIELGSHTDSGGTSDENMKLSDHRVKSAVDYLVYKHGVDKNKLVWKGYGETEIVNKCFNDVEYTKEEHAENRRTELKVLGITKKDWGRIKSLSQIRKEEDLEDIISDFQNQGSIEVKEEETFEQAVERSNKEASSDSKSVSPVIKVQDEIHDKPN